MTNIEATKLPTEQQIACGVAAITKAMAADADAVRLSGTYAAADPDFVRTIVVEVWLAMAQSGAGK